MFGWKSKAERKPPPQETFDRVLAMSRINTLSHQQEVARIALDEISGHAAGSSSGIIALPRRLELATAGRHAAMREGARDESDAKYAGYSAAEALCEAALHDRQAYVHMLAQMKAWELELWPERKPAQVVPEPPSKPHRTSPMGTKHTDGASASVTAEEREGLTFVFQELMGQVDAAPVDVQLEVAHALNLVNTIFAQEIGGAAQFREKSVGSREQYLSKLAVTAKSYQAELGESAGLATSLFYMWLAAAHMGERDMEKIIGTRLAKLSRLIPGP